MRLVLLLILVLLIVKQNFIPVQLLFCSIKIDTQDALRDNGCTDIGPYDVVTDYEQM